MVSLFYFSVVGCLKLIDCVKFGVVVEAVIFAVIEISESDLVNFPVGVIACEIDNAFNNVLSVIGFE